MINHHCTVERTAKERLIRSDESLIKIRFERKGELALASKISSEMKLENRNSFWSSLNSFSHKNRLFRRTKRRRRRKEFGHRERETERASGKERERGEQGQHPKGTSEFDADRPSGLIYRSVSINGRREFLAINFPLPISSISCFSRPRPEHRDFCDLRRDFPDEPPNQREKLLYFLPPMRKGRRRKGGREMMRLETCRSN